MSTLQTLDQGKVAYADKRYEDSIRHLSTVLSNSNGNNKVQLDAYNTRCQAYSKLGKLDLALQDARNMIHVSKKQAVEGYLRCSQIECLSGNFVTAAKWLEHGSKHAPEQRLVFEKQLAKVQELAANAIVRQKRQDPLTSVPFEILQMILEYFEYDEIVRLLRVSRSWKKLFSQLRPLTTTVDFSKAREQVSYQGCSSAFRRLCRHPQRIILASLSQPARKVAQAWLQNSTRLESLEVLHLSSSNVYVNLTSLGKLYRLRSFAVGPAQKVTLAMMTTFIGQHQSLQNFRMYDIGNGSQTYLCDTIQTQLQHIYLEGNGASPIGIPAVCFENFPNLRSINLRRCSVDGSSWDLSSHQHLRILRLDLFQQRVLVMSLPDSLEELSCTANYDSSPTLSISEPVNLPNLRKIAFRRAWAFAAIDAIQCSRETPSLQHVQLSDVSFMVCVEKAEHNRLMFAKCQHLCMGTTDLTDDHISDFSSLFPVLETLTIEAPLITGVFISGIVSKSQRLLRKITMNDCGKISPDISSWLRARNIECQIVNTQTESKGARRIRNV